MIRIGVVRNEKGEVRCVFCEPNSDKVAAIVALAVQLKQTVTFHKPKPHQWLIEQMQKAVEK